jgi:putative hydrolase of the HAD superfamily
LPDGPDSITTVSFDGDGTLWDFQKVMRHSLSHALGELRRAAPAAAAPLTIETMIAIREEVARELRGKETNLENVRLAAFRKTLEHIGLRDDALAAHLNAVYLKHRFEDIELFADVAPTLDALRGRYVLGLISNGNTYPEHTGLGGRFRFVVFSQDHGVEKPDRRLFEVAMEQAGCTARQLLHVGNSLVDDVGGASKAGARTAWLNRERSKPETGIQPDFEISSLAELPDICDTLAQPSRARLR